MVLNSYKLIFLFFFFCNLLYSQENKQLLANYSLYNNDAKEIYQINLRIDRTKAYSDFYKIQDEKDTIADTMIEDDFGNIKMNVRLNIKNKDTISPQYFLTKDSITFRDHIYTNKQFIPVIVTEKTPNFNWKLEQETITIGNYLCNKATLKFRGRNYNIWYTTEIPTQFGPWKFYGLPGLIVKIESDDKSILFQLTKLSFVEKKELEKPSLGTKITFKEYVNYQEKVVVDIIEKLKAKLPRGASVKVNKMENSGIEKNFEQ